MSQNGVILGQKTVPEKTNEIPVVRELLTLFDFAGKVITADAMHCNRETAEKIIHCNGNYVLALKGNQGAALEEISTYLEDCIADEKITVETYRKTEKNKDRIETRTCYKAPTLEWFSNKHQWSGLMSAYAIKRTVTTKYKTTTETAYFISSLDASPAYISKIVRAHWQIEAMHWMLDVTFGEDASRVTNEKAHQSLNIMHKLSLAMHSQFVKAMPQKTKPSLKNHMLQSLINNDTLLAVITNLS